MYSSYEYKTLSCLENGVTSKVGSPTSDRNEIVLRRADW